jgi:3-phenylpropionate/trans-cinnamate dioxygenase ferredoxin reductase component
MHFDVLIVGGGHGGAQVAIMLRQLGFGGSIAILSDEADPPYERPPLSKEYLSGEKTFDRILIRPRAFWGERCIKLLLLRRVVAVHPLDHSVVLQDGERLFFGRLIWAAGGEPRRLPGMANSHSHVHSVRTRDDVDGIANNLARVERVIVVGGGYIGLESAAVLTQLGKKVTLVEASDRVLARVAGEPISRFYEAEHRSRGVDVKTSFGVRSVAAGAGASLDVELSNGERVNADRMIVGIGIAPIVEPLLAAGAACGNGVHVDRFCRTSLADIFAIGDCAAHENRFAGGNRIRLESVQNAVDQANVVANFLNGQADPYLATPWFWSNQYDLKLQTIGLSAGYDDLVVRGDPTSRSFSVAYLKKGRIIALDAVNSVRDFVQAKGLVESQTLVRKAQLADASLHLKTLAALPP